MFCVNVHCNTIKLNLRFDGELIELMELIERFLIVIGLVCPVL